MKAEALEKVGFVGSCMSSPQSYASSVRSYGTPNAKQIAAFALRALDEARQKDIDAHERNLPKIEANKAVRDAVTALMKEVGIPDTWSRKDTKSRARFPKSIREDAGYIGDLNRNAPISDGFDYQSARYNSLKELYDRYADEAEKEGEKIAAAKAQEEEQRKAERRKNLQLAEIVLRYKLDPDIEWDGILGALRKKDQRLDLAVAMQLTRGDWSDGYYRVSAALSNFTVTTTEDAQIQTDVLSCFNGDIDGRVFRDTSWNYDRLFTSATDQQLAADVMTALLNAERD